MNNYKTLCLLLICNGCACVQHTENQNNFKTFIQRIDTKFKKNARNAADWIEYYREITTQNLYEWVQYCKTKSKIEADAFKNFTIDEGDATFKKLNSTEQKTLRDLNKFYHDLASANKEKQQQIIDKFNTRWEEIRETLNQKS